MHLPGQSIRVFLPNAVIFELNQTEAQMKLLYPIAILLLIMGCKSTDNTTNTTDDTQMDQGKPKRKIQIKAQIGDAKEKDPVRINDVSIEGNTLFIAIQYTGGCKKHSFELIGDESIMKSLPPKRNITLVHDANEDSCEGLIKDMIEADISELAATAYSGSEIILILKGYKEEIKYIYK